MKTLRLITLLMGSSILISCGDDKCKDEPDLYIYMSESYKNKVSYKLNDTIVFQNKTGAKITCVLIKTIDSTMRYNTSKYCTKYQHEIYESKYFIFNCIEDTNYSIMYIWHIFDGYLQFDKINYGGGPQIIDTLTVAGKSYTEVYRKSAETGYGPYFYYTYKNGIIKIETYKTKWERIN